MNIKAGKSEKSQLKAGFIVNVIYGVNLIFNVNIEG